MALIRQDSGCKVGWETYDNKDEAMARSKVAREQAIDMAQRGYDFGYQSPGEVRQGQVSRYRDGKFDESLPVVMLDEWTVTVP